MYDHSFTGLVIRIELYCEDDRRFRRATGDPKGVVLDDLSPSFDDPAAGDCILSMLFDLMGDGRLCRTHNISANVKKLKS